MNKFFYNPEDWDSMVDTPEEFEEALINPFSTEEKDFLEQMRYKISKEIAASNEVLLRDDENEDGIYLLRVGNDDFIVGRITTDSSYLKHPNEIAGLFGFLEFDLYPYLHRHISIKEWLRKRNYKGIRYDRNNDLT